MRLPPPGEDWIEQWIAEGDGRTLDEFYEELERRERREALHALAWKRQVWVSLCDQMFHAMRPFGIVKLEYTAQKQEYTAHHYSGKVISFTMDDLTAAGDRHKWALGFTRRFLLAYKLLFPETELDPNIVEPERLR